MTFQNIHQQPPVHAGSSRADFSSLKMEAISSCETSVHTRSTRRHNPEDGILHSHRRENLKSFIIKEAISPLHIREVWVRGLCKKPDMLMSRLFFNFLIPSSKNAEKVVSNQP
jgi:hypothetical protein